MSAVFLHVGQCGNQLGQQFWQLIQQDEESKRTFFRRDQKLPSIHVDTEKKVIAKLLRNSRQLPVREENIILSKQGRGTNWAMGYHGTSTNRSESMVDLTLEAMRREVERCDSFCGTVMMHSLSGGTGSGLGSRLCEAVRDAYPMAYILDVAVAPHTQGESPLQHYNNLFCLSWLQKFADCVVLYHNDEVLRHLQGLNITKGNRDAADVDIKMMNKYITDSLAGLLCPITSNTTKSGISCGNEPWELLRSVAPMPAYKFLHASHLVKSKSTWESMMTNLIQSSVRYDADGQHLIQYSSLASLIAVRGDTTSTFTRNLPVIERKLKGALNFVEWNPFPIDFWIGNQQGVLPKDSSSMTMCVNTSRIMSMMQRVQSRAQSMYEAKAFLHWYQRYNCDEMDFEDAFTTVNQVIKDYESAPEG